MRRLMTGLALACLLLGTVSVPTTAQDPSPEPVGVGGRVEVPELGVALTFPDDWVWGRYVGPDIDPLVGLLGAITSPDAAEEYRPVLAELEPAFPLFGSPVLADGSLGGACLIGALPTSDSLAEITAGQRAWMEDSESVAPGGVETTDLVLPLGEASRLDVVYRDEVGYPPLVNSTYMIVDDTTLYAVACQGQEFPEDFWLPVAEALESLPHSAQSSGLLDRLEPSGGRVEVAEAGYALTFPDGWLVVRPMGADATTLVAGIREIEPALASIVEAGLAGGMGLTLMAFGPVGEDGWSQGCNVLSSPMAGQSMDDIIDAEVAAFELAGDTIVSGPDLTRVGLPVGDVWRIDYRMSMRGIERATSVHFFHDGLQRHTLTCADWVQPDDGWLSIAETFEVLPAEE